MGKMADNYLPEKLPAVETKACLTKIVSTFPALKAQAKGEQGEDIQPAIDAARDVLALIAKDPAGALPNPDTANALRVAIGCGADSPVIQEAKGILDPADNFGGRMSFRWIAPFAIILVIIFGILYAKDRASGGYKAEKIS